jgi:hypothetical protein
MLGPLNDDERSELERLRAENTELRHRTPSQPASRRRGWRGGWRTPLASLLICAGCVLAPLSVLAIWAANQVSDTGRYVANVTPLISEPPIQNALTDKITGSITGQIHVQRLAEQAAATLSDHGMPRAGRLLSTFSGSLSSAVAGFIHGQVARLVASPRAAALWTQLNQAAHAQLVKVLSGAGDGGISTQNGQVLASLGPFVKTVETDLGNSGFGLASKLPPVSPTITLFSSRDLARAQTAYRLINRLRFVLPLTTVLCLGLGIYLARNRRRALLGASLGLVAAMFALGVGLEIARGVYLSTVPPSALPADAAAALFDTLVRFIKDALRALLVLGLVVAATAFFAGPSTSATRARAWLAAGLTRLRRAGALNGPRAERAGRWTYAHRAALRVTSAAIAALIFVFVPGALAAIVLAVLLLLVAGLTELLGRARPRGG